MPKEVRFLDSWLKHSLYSAWIGPGKVYTLASCNWCCRDIVVSNIFESGFNSYIKGKEHFDQVPLDNSQSLIAHFQVSKKMKNKKGYISRQNLVSFKHSLI